MIGLEIDLKKILSAGRIITITATQILGVFFWESSTFVAGFHRQ